VAKLKTKYVCQECGSEQPRWMGKCPECSAWNSLVEEAVAPPMPTGGKAVAQALHSTRAAARME